ncbi:hypothetical protein B484DRAFT_106566 [Ochromonadaceae sp. CCMP2298]|nr:hypothetical protein B484DRAFT_106566 [Ochromonadaceae sp. CCMP2298]
MQHWRSVFTAASQALPPSLSLNLPQHNGPIGMGNRVMVQVSVEGPTAVKISGPGPSGPSGPTGPSGAAGSGTPDPAAPLTLTHSYPAALLHVDNDPPSLMAASPTLFANLNVQPLAATVLGFSLTANVCDVGADVGGGVGANVAAGADGGVGWGVGVREVSTGADVAVREYMGIDRRGRFHALANAVVLHNQREYMRLLAGNTWSATFSDTSMVPYLDLHQRATQPTQPQSQQQQQGADAGSGTPTTTNIAADTNTKKDTADVVPMTYHIKVLAYNRPLSLQRLLTSLAQADYMGHTVSLEILIDGAKYEAKSGSGSGLGSSNETAQAAAAAVKLEVGEIASNFEWLYGPKSVLLQGSNVGLAMQWYNCWKPQSAFEAAFVFEDDLQLSPFYFVWARSAVDKYYQGGQMGLHERLLAAVREHIATNGTVTGPPDAGRDAGVGADATGTGDGTGVGKGMEADTGTGAEGGMEATAGVESDPDSPHALLSPMQRFARNCAGKPLLYGA